MQKVIFHDNGHNNGYHDSYFYGVYLDMETGEFVRHTTHSTAGAGYIPFPEGSIMFAKLSDQDKQHVMDRVKQLAEQAIKDSSNVFIGDTVRVVKGRKYPIGLEFECFARNECKDRYGQIRAHYIAGVHGGVDLKNLSVVNRKLSAVHVDAVCKQLMYDPHDMRVLSFNSRY